jgi:hypothetical protein
MKAYLDCDLCGAPTPVGSKDVLKVTCPSCIAETWDPPKMTSKKQSGYPKGWRFMKVFIHSDGKVFHKGVEQLDLKGTLPPTVIEVKKKLSKFEINEQRTKALLEINELKKKLKKETRSTYIKQYEAKLKKLQKKI